MMCHFEEALELSNIHKMTYFDAAAMIRLKMVLRISPKCLTTV